MATVTSLGIHRPSALPFLVAEGVLPAEPSPSLYEWCTVPSSPLTRDGEEEEEVLTTKHCVVWSRGGVVQRSFRFDVEKETVRHALFTHFDRRVKPGGSVPDRVSNRHRYNGVRELDGLGFDLHINGEEEPRANCNTDIPIPTATDDGMKRLSGLGSGNDRPDQPSHGRALVVVLKTQAHVFFLTGASHVVHLPFEVDRVFALPNGLLLQRQVVQTPAPLTPKLPSVPQNSFAFEALASAEAVRSSQSYANLDDLQQNPSLPFLPMLKNFVQKASETVIAAGLPRLYCLIDPLSEIGIAAMEVRSQTTNYPRGRHVLGASVVNNSDTLDDLLFVSEPVVLEQQASGSSFTSPILAVSKSSESGEYDVWLVEYIDHESSASAHHLQASKSDRRNFRRRTSYGIGTSNGANTPVARGSMAGRESLGMAKSRGSAAMDLLSEDSFNDGEDGLASHLDSALENPRASVKSSRRVSSLLARADLSSTKDKTAFSDLAGAYPASTVTRRGASSGAYAVRLSSGVENGSKLDRNQFSSGVRTSIEQPVVIDPYTGATEAGSDEDTIGGHSKDLSLRHQFLGLRKEMVFTKIHSVASGKVDQDSAIAGAEIFVLKPPAHVARAGPEEADAFLCIADRSSTSLIVMSLRQTLHSRYVRKSEGKVGSREFNRGSRCREFQVTSITRRSDVLDACVLRDTDCYRLLTLRRKTTGQPELCLQDPWNAPCASHLPSTLFSYNPYQIVNMLSPRQKREGGFKRIISQGSQVLLRLRNGGSGGAAVVVDAEGSRHRIHIQLQPRNPLLRTMIKLCDSILPSAHDKREFILNEWWNAMAWLSTISDAEDDGEWTAFVIVLFSIAAGVVADRRAEASTPQKKRKSGLLRSSSGANTNLESWETMLIEESSNLRCVPVWMQDEAWMWTTKQVKVNPSPQAGVSRKPRISRSSFAPTIPPQKKLTYLLHCMSLARDFRCAIRETGNTRESFTMRTPFKDDHSQRMALATLLLGLHLLREELKLNMLSYNAVHDLTPVLAQIGGWLGWPSWGFKGSTYYMLESVDMDAWLFDDTPARAVGAATQPEPFHPPSILHFVEAANLQPPSTSFISLLDVVGYQNANDEPCDKYEGWVKTLMGLTQRTVAINALATTGSRQSTEAQLAELTSWRWDLSILETLPESIALPFRNAISVCQAQPPATSSQAMLEMIGRDDISLQKRKAHTTQPQVSSTLTPQGEAVRDIRSVCASTLEVETVGAYGGAAEADRQSITRMIFKDDQRFAEAAKLLHPLHAPVAKCVPEPDWSDTELLEAQQELAKTIAMRTLAVSPGRSCLFYSARLPLLTEKFPIHGFTLSCIMKPSNTTVTADKAAYTEEKVSWAFFHAGVEAGLSISKSAKGINSSWILFNKPQELKNRHAGFLLALGLNGHLKSIAKWVAFKYLTPKHTMTSIGLLLGLAASYLGTMDTLVTRLLSVHVTRMLPPGAAELNLSPLTQTSGIMGIGLLYCGTQHRRMSEIMLSEMENADEDDSLSPQDSLRDEGYRLAAGFALGYINLGRGKDLKGLHDMQIVERLLALAIGTKKVKMVHILDKATAAATVAIALIFMKTHNEVLARKIDIPDTVHQFEYVRPDIFLLRTVARHLIMWSDIHATLAWMRTQLPMVYQYKAKLTTIRCLNSDDMPFYNIIAGLCLAISLRFAGTGAVDARNLICHYLDQFMRICRLPVLNYDGKLTRITVRNCQDVVALASACVVAGTGDLHVFRRLRALHGRTEVDIPYGSHLATHLAMGILFLGGGTYAFGTSNIAVASLLCAFYPLFPATVLDNKSHLQAFRHFWVLAAEARCLALYDIDTRRQISLPVTITPKSGPEVTMTAPCLLPELNTIAKIQTTDPEYWSVTLDLAGQPSDYQAFSQHRGIWVRRRAAYDANLSLFSSTMQALNDVQSAHTISEHIFQWVFGLKTFRYFDSAEQALVLPTDLTSKVYKNTRGTIVDDRLVLETTCINSGKSERLWNLRILFAWAEALAKSGVHGGWIGKEVVERLRTRLTMKKIRR